MVSGTALTRIVPVQHSPVSIKRNIAANLAGNLWTAVVSIALVPLYIHFMGIEAYGLVGLFAALQAMLALLDMGLSTTLNREMARLSVLPGKAQDMRDLVRTLEIIYGLMALAIGIAIVSLAPLIAGRWVQARHLSPHVIEQAVMLMGLILLFQWPAGLYSGGLLGLQRQVLLNVVTVISATFRGGGVILILWLVSPTIQAFFLWQTVISLFTTVTIAWLLWRSLPAAEQSPRFNRRLLKTIRSFAAGTTGLTIQGVILTQMDKVVLTKWVPLDVFGYYTLAASVAQNLGRLISPVTAAVFPRFAQLHAQQNEPELARLYHRSCQLLAVLILPAAAMLAFFPAEILMLWTRNPETVQQTHLLLALLAVGGALNSLMYIPSILQTAVGWLSLALWINTVSIAAFIPLALMSTVRYGAVGMAGCWIILNAVCVLVAPHLIHRRLLAREKWSWYFRDVSRPLGAAVLTAWLFQSLRFMPQSSWVQLGYLALIYGVVLLVTIASATQIRDLVSARIAGVLRI